MRRSAILAILLIPLAATFLRAEDLDQERRVNWHHWRGPLASGSSPTGTPPLHWDANTNVKWKAALPGRGSSTPIVWKDQVFVLTAIKTDRTAEPGSLPPADPRFPKKTTAPTNYYQFVVLSFDRGTGALRWRRIATEQVPHEGHHPTHSYAAGSPTCDGRYLYVCFGSHGLYCYRLDGTLVWQRDLGKLNTRLGWGEAVTPVVDGDALLLNWDQEAASALLCLDARTGQTRWKADRDEKTSWNTPLVIHQGDKSQVVVNGTTRIRSYDLASGRLLWTGGGMTVNPIPSPVADSVRVYCMSGYTGSAACAIPLDARGDLAREDQLAWRHGRGTPYVPSPLLLDGRLYFTQANNALLTVLDAAHGTPLLDRVRLPGQTSFYASPVAAAGRIYLADREGVTLVLKPSDKLEVLASNRLDDGFDASPAIAGKQLFLRGQKYLYCLEEGAADHLPEASPPSGSR
jgi:outer membrane protein assembly factor BamB